MNLSKSLPVLLMIGVCAACSDAPEPAGEVEVETGTESASSGKSIDMADYGFIDGVVVKPIDMPDWLPADLKLPDDFVPVEELYMAPINASILRGVTNEPIEDLFDSLSADLIAAGYDVRLGDDYRADNLVYFSGNGYEDSTISIRPGPNDTLLDIALIPAR